MKITSSYKATHYILILETASLYSSRIKVGALCDKTSDLGIDFKTGC